MGDPEIGVRFQAGANFSPLKHHISPVVHGALDSKTVNLPERELLFQL
jgi:hypothetical protein